MPIRCCYFAQPTIYIAFKTTKTHVIIKHYYNCTLLQCVWGEVDLPNVTNHPFRRYILTAHIHNCSILFKSTSIMRALYMKHTQKHHKQNRRRTYNTPTDRILYCIII